MIANYLRETSRRWIHRFAIANLLLYLFLGLTLLTVLLPTSPLWMPLTYRDSGVFLYGGWRLTDGAIPYVDFWDHKPPVVFYLNALGLMLANGSRWGVWVLELFSLTVSVLLGYRLVLQTWGKEAAFFAITLFLISLGFTIQGGNLTTEYTLPLQFAAFFIFYRTQRQRNSKYRMWEFLLGLLWGVAFLTKQNTIGVFFAIVLYILGTNWAHNQMRSGIRSLVGIVAGAVTVGIVTTAWFTLNGAFAEMVDAAFAYNLLYLAGPSLKAHIYATLDGFLFLSTTGIITWASIGSVTALLWLRFDRLSLPPGSRALLTVALVDLPLEFLLTNLSGVSHPHYYMAALPVLTLLTGFGFFSLLKALHRPSFPDSARFLFTVTLAFLHVILQSERYLDLVGDLRQVGHAEVVRYVEQQTSEDEYVLVWGAETYVNFFARRRSPTRFVYQYPLFNDHYVDNELIAEFLFDLAERPPTLIIDALGNDLSEGMATVPSEALKTGISQVMLEYRKAERFGSWVVYRRAVR